MVFFQPRNYKYGSLRDLGPGWSRQFCANYRPVFPIIENVCYCYNYYYPPPPPKLQTTNYYYCYYYYNYYYY